MLFLQILYWPSVVRYGGSWLQGLQNLYWSSVVRFRGSGPLVLMGTFSGQHEHLFSSAVSIRGSNNNQTRYCAKNDYQT